MDFPQAIHAGFQNYVNFEGRASRSEYWYFALFLFLGNIGIGIISSMLDSSSLSALWSLGTLLPSIAVAVRRLHDTEKTGWLFLLPITIIGIIPYLIWLIQKGNEGENKYGADPLAS